MSIPLRLLLVEDSPRDAELILHELRRAGFEPQGPRVETAADYQTQLELSPDVILADYTLPEFDALRALHLLKARGLDIPFIVVSGNISEEVAVECMKQGAADYLIKDRLARLGPAVERALREAEARRANQQAEAVLRESESRFRVLIHDLNVGVLLQGPQAEILLSNQAALEMLGLTEDQLLGKTSFDPDWNVIHEDGSDFPGLTHPVPQAIVTGRPVRNVVMGVYRPARRDRVWLLVNAEPQLNAQGEVRQVICTFTDITEPKRAEEALRESQERFELATLATNDAIWDRNLLTDESWWNDKHYTLLGYRPSEVKPGFESWSAHIHPEDRERVLAHFNATLERGETVWTNEYRFVRTDGSVGHLFDRGHILRDPAGRPVRMIGAMTDITERKRAEETLRESEQRYRDLFVAAQRQARELALLAQVRTALAREMDLPGLFRAVVRAIAEAFGYTHVSLFLLQGETLIQQHRVGYRGHAITEIPITQGVNGRVARTGQPVLLEDARQDPDFLESVPGIISQVCVPLVDLGQVAGTLSVESAQDVKLSQADLRLMLALSEHINVAIGRARLYTELQEREKRFRMLIENSSDGILLIAADGALKYASPATARLLGYAPGELIGQDAFQIIHPDDRPAITELFARLMQTPGAAVTGQARYRRKDAVWRWMETIGTNLLAEPSVQAIVTNFRDITERKQHEREQAAIIAMTSALRQARTRAEMLPVLLDELLPLLNADGASLDMVDPASGETVTELGRGEWARVTGLRTPPGKGVSAQVVATGQPYLNNDIRSDARIFKPELLGSVRAVACVPLIAHEQTIGVLWVGRQSEIAPEEIRLLTAIGDMAANAIQRATLHEQTEQHLRRLTALRAIDAAITSSLDLRLTLNVVLEQTLNQLGVHAAAVLLLNPHTQQLEHFAGRGFRSNAIALFSLQLGEGHAGRAALDRRILHIPNLKATGLLSARAEMLAGENFVAYWATPLIAKGQVKGVLEVFQRAPLTPDPEWLGFLETLAGQTAIAVDNHALFDNLQRSNLELKLAYDETIEGWSRALDLRDHETEGHTQRVTEMALRLAEALGIKRDELLYVRWGALLHDIGKMGIPDGILLKPGPLSEAEWAIMRQHPVYAYEMLAPIAHLQPALDIPYCHHEKWDGTGYPRGLKGEAIPLSARIFAIADVWDALRSDRPYRQGEPVEQVRGHLRAQSGAHFDPQIVETFLRLGLGE